MNGNVSRAVKWMCRDRCEKPLELRVFLDTDFVSELTQRPVLGGPTIVEPEIRQLYPEIEPDSPTTQFLQRDHSEAGECELNHRWRHGSHRSTGDEAHNSSSTDKRQRALPTWQGRHSDACR